MEKRKIIFLMSMIIPTILVFLTDLIILTSSGTRYNLPKFNNGIIENSGFVFGSFYSVGGYFLLFCVVLVFSYLYYKDLKKEEPTWSIVIVTTILGFILLLSIFLMLPPNSDLKCKILVPSYEGECHNANLMGFKELAQKGELSLGDCKGDYGCILNLAISKKDISICDNVPIGGYLTRADCISVFNREVVFCNNSKSIITEAQVSTGLYPDSQKTDNELCKENLIDETINKSRVDTCEFLNKTESDYDSSHPGVGEYIFKCNCSICI